jgi:predicted nucleotidyltransferase
VAKKKPGARKPAKGKVAESPKVYEHTAERVVSSPSDVPAALRSAAEELASPPTPPDWRAALADFTAALKRLYGPRLDGVVLYGSRARGAAEPLSDIDALVVLKDCEDFWAELDRLCPIAARVCLDRGVVISARPASAKELAESQSSLFIAIRREGKRVA